MSEMTKECFDIGTIQAFLDGELDNDSVAQVAHHVSVCDDCAQMLAEAENETALAFDALDSELNYLVPTERIRTNLYEAIAAEKKPFWKRIFGENFSLTNPSLAAFASLILVFGIFLTFFIVREKRLSVTNETARAEQSKPVQIKTGDVLNSTGAETSAKDQEISDNAPQVETANAKTTFGNRPIIQNADYKVRKSSVKNQTPNKNGAEENVTNSGRDQGLVGEESYIKTIATLNETVNSRKDEILRPSERVSFEKDLAVVNDSIAKMQKEVRKNPKNEAAKELLRSSYQNKIDLLNSVADKTEIMAVR